MARQAGLWALRQAEPVQPAHLVKKVLKHRMLKCLSASPGPQSGQQLCQAAGRVVEQHVCDALAAADPHQGFLPALAHALSEAVHLPLMPAEVCLQGADLRLQAACLTAQGCLQDACMFIDFVLQADLGSQTSSLQAQIGTLRADCLLPRCPARCTTCEEVSTPFLALMGKIASAISWTGSWQMQGPPSTPAEACISFFRKQSVWGAPQGVAHEPDQEPVQALQAFHRAGQHPRASLHSQIMHSLNATTWLSEKVHICCSTSGSGAAQRPTKAASGDTQ